MKKLLFLLLLLTALSACAKKLLNWQLTDTSHGQNLAVRPGYWDGHSHVILTNKDKHYYVTCYTSGAADLFLRKPESEYRVRYWAITDTAFKGSDGRDYYLSGARSNIFAQDAQSFKKAPRIRLSQAEWALIAEGIAIQNQRQQQIASEDGRKPNWTHILKMPDTARILFFAELPDAKAIVDGDTLK